MTIMSSRRRKKAKRFLGMTPEEQAKAARVMEKSKPAVEIIWNYDRTCSVCGNFPVVSQTGICGSCTFGEADTAIGDI
jgi:hypothetical protein